jgi:dihydrofolate reductase
MTVMRELIVTENITLDGVIDASEGWFVPSGSADPAEMEEMARVEAEHRAEADAVLLGRVTYEEFAGYWPQQTDDRTGVARYLDEATKYVVSSTLKDPAWQHTEVLRGDVVTEVAALKGRAGRAIVATGSVRLVQTLVRAGLVDEYRLFVYPTVLGRGRRLFEHATDVPRLSLVQAQPFPTGIVLLRYRMA